MLSSAFYIIAPLIIMKGLPRFVTSAIALSGLLLASPAARAIVLVNDNFTLSAGTGSDAIESTESPDAGAYVTLHGTSGLSATKVEGFGTDTVLGLSNTNNTYHRAFNGSATLTLANLEPNQTLSLSFDIRFDGGTFAGAQNFSFGFINAPSSDSILYANINLAGGPSEFRHRPGSFNMSDAGTQLGSGWSEPPTASGTAYSFQIEITKLADGGVRIAYYRGNALLGSHTEPGNGVWVKKRATTEITGIAFRHSQTPGLKTYIDNVFVSLTTSIP